METYILLTFFSIDIPQGYLQLSKIILILDVLDIKNDKRQKTKDNRHRRSAGGGKKGE
jgi:hypothetical protein